MINIRKSTFETNSSSTHSLVFSNKDRGYNYDLPVDENGILTIPFGEFGWGPDILKTPLDKLSYYITDRAPYIEDDDEMEWEDLIKIVLKKSPEIKELIDLIKLHCPQIKEIKFEKCDSYWPLGYVDHQSCGTTSGEDPEELIFNNSILILIDNDNSCRFEKYRPGYDYHTHKNTPSEKSKEDLFDLEMEQLTRPDYW